MAETITVPHPEEIRQRIGDCRARRKSFNDCYGFRWQRSAPAI